MAEVRWKLNTEPRGSSMSNDSEQQTPSWMVEWIEKAAIEFDELCYARHQTGAVEYGPYAFLENDIWTMLAEELADAVNYCKYLYIKTSLLRRLYESGVHTIDEGARTDTELRHSPGATSFVGTRN